MGESDFQCSSCMFLCCYCFLTSCLFNANRVYLDCGIRLILYFFFIVVYFKKSNNISYSLEAGEKGVRANLATIETDLTNSNSKHENRVREAEVWGRENPLPEIILWKGVGAKNKDQIFWVPEWLLHYTNKKEGKGWWGRELTFAECLLWRHFIQSPANFCP